MAGNAGGASLRRVVVRQEAITSRVAAVIPRTRYATTDGGMVAYQVIGEGPDLIYLPNWTSHVELQWEEASYARFLHGLASFSRLICFDKRGAGLSEHLPFTALPTLEQWMDDILAVMDAAGSQRTAILATDVGGMLGVLFAATYPERVSHLILIDAYSRVLQGEGYDVGVPPEYAERFHGLLEGGWGDPDARGWIDVLAPGAAADQRFRSWFSRLERFSGTPALAGAMSRVCAAWDLRPVLGSVPTPTLVMHHQSRRNIRPAHGRYLAEHIPDARYLELPGEDALVYRDNASLVISEVRGFVTGVREAPESDRVLATVLFTDIVSSTEQAAELGDRRWRDLLDAHDREAESRVLEHRGRIVKSTGDGVLATFDGPARAIRCAQAISRQSGDLGLRIRAGLHTGEVEVRGADISGIAVHIAARVMSAAHADEILVSRTVRDLVTGSGLSLESRGSHQLKGLEEKWELYALRR
jgi:class 3 adenylate cyclase